MFRADGETKYSPITSPVPNDMIWPDALHYERADAPSITREEL